MIEAHCPECNRVFIGDSESHAAFKLAMHRSKKHDVHPTKRKRGRPRKVRMVEASTPPAPATRPRINAPQLRYCPCCGTDLGMLARAMAVAASIKG
jgi:hypothetical protein